MIRRSRAIAISALGLSAALHAGGFTTLWGREDIRVAGGAPASVARLGNSFQDVAAGVTAPEITERLSEPPETPVLEPETALTRGVRPEIPATERPLPSELMKPEAPDIPALDLPKSALPDTPALIASLPTKPAPTPAPQPQVLTAQPIRPQQTVRPEPTEAARPEPSVDTPPSQVIKALPEPEGDALQVSRRPPPRPDRIEDREIARAKPKPQPRGQAAQNQVRGEVTGQKQATAERSSDRQSTRAAAAGNAAVSNYPGQVMRRITRLRRPSTRSRGTATVAFTVAADGGLASARIARSSGAADLDNAALALVRRAAPFPPPPSGAQRSFQIGIKGR